MAVSVTRGRPNRIARDRAARGRVAVLAATAADAASAGREIAARLPSADVEATTLEGYLATPDAPERIVLCVTDRPGARAFLRRAVARLLWPPPHADVFEAVAGLREPHRRPRRLRTAAPARPSGGLPSALLLEGPVDAARARAALRSAPRDWIVESARHVRLGGRALAALAREGVAWSALEPVELLAVYAPESPRGDLGLPPGTPVWIRPGPGPRR